MTDSEELCRRILDETGVAFLPGSVFGRPRDELSVRIACVDFDGAAALEALSEVKGRGAPDERWLAGHCAPAYEGVERLCRWLEGAA